MGKHTFELSDQQFSNLKVFLQRVTLSANEIPAYIDVQNALSKELKQPEGEGE